MWLFLYSVLGLGLKLMSRNPDLFPIPKKKIEIHFEKSLDQA
jgi:hypothetical protein